LVSEKEKSRKSLGQVKEFYLSVVLATLKFQQNISSPKHTIWSQGGLNLL
jgi:hypothetical protein